MKNTKTSDHFIKETLITISGHIFLFLLIIFLLVFVIPNLTKIIANLEESIPRLTLIVLYISDFISSRWLIYIPIYNLILIIDVVLFIFYYKSKGKKTAYKWSRLFGYSEAIFILFCLAGILLVFNK